MKAKCYCVYMVKLSSPGYEWRGVFDRGPTLALVYAALDIDKTSESVSQIFARSFGACPLCDHGKVFYPGKTFFHDGITMEVSTIGRYSWEK